MKINWQKTLPHLAAIAVIVLINIFYFFPQFNGKVVEQVDIVSNRQATSALKEYRETNDKMYLWNPSSFGGMPVLSGAPSSNNLIYEGYTWLRLGFDEPIGLYIAGCLMSYLLLILLGVNPWLSLAFSVTMVLSTSNIILWEAGHNSKVRTLMFTPLLIAGVMSIFENKKYLPGFLLLSIGFAMSFYTRHPQMTYYILLVFMIYGFFILWQTIKSQDWRHFAKGVLIVISSLLIGMATSASMIWSLYDYSKVTMRGDAILKSEKPSAQASSSEMDGLAWDYAMQWSNDYKDLMATYIPGFVGGGGGEKVSTKSASYKNYGMKRAPLYWGQLPFTEGPMYLGASIIFLFVLGLAWVQGNIKWWLGVGTLWMLLLSMGSNFAILNHFIFDYLPFYSTFRAPQSVLSITSFFIAILAALALKELLATKFTKKKSKSKKKKVSKINPKSLAICYGICAGIALFFALVGPSIYNFTGSGDASYAQQGIDVSHLVADRKSLMSADAWRTFLIVSIIAGMIWAYMKNKINKVILTSIIALIVLYDIVSVDLRYLSHEDYVNPKRVNLNFEPRPADQAILNIETDRSKYRVHDVTINSFFSSKASVFHNTIGGYSAVKMQRIEDLINRHLRQNNIQVFNMLNTKYFIVQGQDGNPTVQRNPGALGVGWFVSNIQKVSSPQEEIDALNTINTANTAVVLESEFSTHLDGINSAYDSTAIVEMSAYEPDMVTYKVGSNTGGLVVFSEMWYGPNKGWQAYIDGVPSPHIRANYALRAMNIPSGSHEVKFEFRPKPFYTGEKISLASSIILILIAGGGLFYSAKKNKLL